MDSTPPHPTQPLPLSARNSKLPIKRKTPDYSPNPNPNANPNPNPNPNPSSSPILTPNLESTTDVDDDDYEGAGGDRKPPPFKFHRIWTEPDEIRFLQGLVDCSSEGLSFPRDLSVFYARFCDTMSHPYTKSQLSEKLRRLRKKFRVISSRLAKGLDRAPPLSPHDRALYDLSKQLWHPEYSSTSPFSAGGNSNKPKKSNLVGVKVSFSPTIPSSSELALISVSNNQSMIHKLNDNNVDHYNDDDGYGAGLDVDGDVKLSEVNVEFEDGVGEGELPIPSGGIGEVAAKAVIDVFDQSLKEVRMALGHYGSGSSKEEKNKSIEKRWTEQRIAEFDVLARRLRLVLDHSLQRQ